MKKHNILSKLKRISRKIACIIATAVMCLNNIGLNQIKQVSAQTSMGNAYKITENDSTKNKWQNTDKNGDQMTHRFSSYESDKSKALKVDASYGFKLQKTSATKVTVTKGTKCAAPSKFNGEDLELLAFMKKYTWFKTSKNTANNIQIKISDLTVYQCNSDGSNGHWVKVDLVRTITAIEKYKNQDGYIALGSGITDAVYIGIEEMTVNNVFYKAGTSQKVTLKSNVTLTDIDTRQYIGVSASKIDGQYVSNNTTLSYLKNGNKNFYYADNDINYSGEAKTAVGFIFEDSSFVYTFGRIKPEEPTNQEQYVGTGQSMTEFEPSFPVKTVTDQDEKDVKENTVEHLGGNWTYTVEQSIPSNIPSNFYYDNFSFEDQIESCMKINSIRVEAENAEAKVTDVTSMFKITSNGNKVVAKLKNSKNANFYKNTVYRLKINVQMNIPDGATESQMEELRNTWKEHGHYNTKETMITEKNTAKTIINDKIEMTNEVRVDIELPKENGDTPGLLIRKETKQYEYQAKDEITYKVTVKNQNEKAKTAYFTIQDTSFASVMDMKLQDIKISGLDKEDYILQTENNGFILKSKGDYALPYGQTIEITYTVKSGVLTNGKVIDNTVSAWAAGIPETKASRQVYINSPKNNVIKSAPVQLYKKGDHVTYQAVITNPNPGTFMRNLEIQDELQAEGIKIIPGTVAVISGGKNIASECKITFDPSGRSYEIITPFALKNGTIPAMGSEEGKKTGSYENLRMTDKIEITYQAVIEEDGLEGQEVKNIMHVAATKNSNGDLIREDKEIPSGSGMADETIKVKAPKLQITKQSDKKVYAVGETGYYKLHITQGKEGMTAQNVKVVDEFEKEGMKVQKIEVKLNKKDITSDCKIDAKDHQFTIETGKDLGENDVMTVTYQVVFEKRIEGAVKNTAVAGSDNTEDDQDENTVVVKPPVLKIEKSTAHKSYKEGQSGEYKIRVTQRNENMTAHQVVVEDHFEQEGMEISQIRVKYNGEDITKQCEIIIDENLRKFKIITGKDVSDKDELLVIYQTAFKKMITGDIKNIAESYSDDADKVRDDQVVVMEAVQPALMITKKVDKTTYKVGDICEYQLVVTQTIKDAIAKNIVIEDQLSRNGAKVIKNSIKIYAPDGSDITRQCTITAGENKYVIETGKNLSYDESIKVSYQVKLKEASLSGKTLKNTATGKADFVKPVSAVRLVKIKKESKSTVTTGNKADRSNTSEYKRSPGTRDAASTPKTGDSFDEKWIFALLAASLGGSFIYWKKKKKH